MWLLYKLFLLFAWPWEHNTRTTTDSTQLSSLLAICWREWAFIIHWTKSGAEWAGPWILPSKKYWHSQLMLWMAPNQNRILKQDSKIQASLGKTMRIASLGVVQGGNYHKLQKLDFLGS